MDRRLPFGPRRYWDEDARIDALLACHPRTVIDPERAWGIAGGERGAGSATGSLGSRLLSRLLAAAGVLALAGRDGEVGWPDLDEPSTADLPRLEGGRDETPVDVTAEPGDELDDGWQADADAA